MRLAPRVDHVIALRLWYHLPHATRYCNCNSMKKLHQNPVNPDSRLDLHRSLPCENVQTSGKDADEITFEVVDEEQCSSRESTDFLGSRVNLVAMIVYTTISVVFRGWWCSRSDQKNSTVHANPALSAQHDKDHVKHDQTSVFVLPSLAYSNLDKP